MVPLKETFRAVTVWPLTVTVAFHEPESVCPAGRVNVTVQPLMAVLPLLVMLTGWTTYPVAHWVCTTPRAVQVPGAPVVGGALVGGRLVVGGVLVGGALVGGRLVVGGALVGGVVVFRPKNAMAIAA